MPIYHGIDCGCGGHGRCVAVTCGCEHGSPITALIAVAMGEHKDVVLLLLDRSADLTKATYYNSVFMVAVAAGSMMLCRCYFDRGADMNVVNACLHGIDRSCGGGVQLKDIVRLLLSRGAGPDMIIPQH